MAGDRHEWLRFAPGGFLTAQIPECPLPTISRPPAPVFLKGVSPFLRGEGVPEPRTASRRRRQLPRRIGQCRSRASSDPGRWDSVSCAALPEGNPAPKAGTAWLRPGTDRLCPLRLG